MRVAIRGLTKTGTTALYYTLKAALPDYTDGYFEPRPQDLPRILGRRALASVGIGRDRPVLAKFLPFCAGRPPVWRAFAGFGHTILTVRDPRDRLISGLLYQIYNSAIPLDEARVHAVLAQLRRKQHDPASVSLRDLLALIRADPAGAFDFAAWVDGFRAETIDRPLRFAAETPGVFEFRYEDLVDARLHPLADYLGLPLAGVAEVDPRVTRVVRTRAYGGWRSWFTPADVALFEPLMRPYLARYYPGADWSLDPAPHIDPAHGSSYVVRIVDERRRLEGLAPLVG